MDKKNNCSECKRKIIDLNYFMVDDQPVCNKCLFGKVEPVTIYPIEKVS